jgi:hypothetical protein
MNLNTPCENVENGRSELTLIGIVLQTRGIKHCFDEGTSQRIVDKLQYYRFGVTSRGAFSVVVQFCRIQSAAVQFMQLKMVRSIDTQERNIHCNGIIIRQQAG